MNRRRGSNVLVALATAALLAGCTAPSEPEDDPAGAEPATTASESSADAEAEAEAASEASTDAGAASGSPSVEACEEVVLEADEQVTGEAVAACAVGMLMAYGSGREYVDDGETYGEADFLFTEDLRSFDAVMHTADGDAGLIVIGADAWLEMDGAWVASDPDSTDPGEQMAAMVGGLYRALADPITVMDVLSGSDTWTVQEDRELITLPDGTDVNAWQVVADEPFTWGEVQVTDWVLWFGSDHTPVGNRGTSTMFGFEGTSSQIFYDLGADITIEPPL
ncbi:hypothetical protein [Ruania halotolerans]|uniref:hypothetical protein n=1 Tax=Ruania halotolerans TaxID=2897773 RepID=UPI001E5C5D21|nr:hypothetical protein [Ruania halotolerans]UFU06517.1 hypothetical protein LQF10_19205 [Ruania halotolerans]